MKVAIIGTRGIPAKYGGFETFAQELAPRLVNKGLDVTVFCPNSTNGISIFRGVNLKYLQTSKDKAPMRYYMESVKEAVKDRFDIVLTCGQGGYGYIPYMLKRKRPVFITNTDGIEHRRTKWNKIVRLGVRVVGEMTSVLLSDYLVADSKGIKDYLNKEYSMIPHKHIYTIEYGADVISPVDYSTDLIGEYGIKPNEYFLVVSRIEPENNVAMIIEGYKKSGSTLPLVVVGNLKDNEYSMKLRNSAAGYDVRFVGGIYDPNKLKAIRLYCKAYLHGHSVGGTNPSLLEALGAGNIVIGHDNPFNREVTDNKMFYFANADECAKAIKNVEALSTENIKQFAQIATERIMNYYNWDRIADEYYNMLNECYKTKNK